MQDMVGLKKCNKCNEFKPVEEYNKYLRARDGLKPRCRSCCSDDYRDYHWANRDKELIRVRENNFMRLYGITLGDRDKMYDAQEGRCACCNEAFPPIKSTNGTGEMRLDIHVDHCHRTGKIRALLCSSCNTFIGMYEKHRIKIEAYLDKHKEKEK